MPVYHNCSTAQEALLGKLEKKNTASGFGFLLRVCGAHQCGVGGGLILGVLLSAPHQSVPETGEWTVWVSHHIPCHFQLKLLILPSL